MAAITPLEFARKLTREDRHLDATHVLETSLLMNGKDFAARLLLAQAYVVLKENHYRARARSHLEAIVAGAAPGPIFQAAANLLVKQVYLTNGPVEKAKALFADHPDCFSDADKLAIGRKISEIDSYLKLDSSSRRRSAPPAYLSEVSNNDLALKAFVFKEFQAQVAGRDTGGAYFTFGSCFAGNVARAMKAAGFAIDSFWVGEEVNTTFSNVNLLKFILGEQVEHADYYAEVLAGHDTARLRASLQAADNVIYTLGVALAFFEGGAGYTPHNPGNLRALLRRKDAAYRFSTVQENVEALLQMRDLLERHTRVRNVFLTVSPVPLAASLLSSSAAVDDSESKAILRSAAGVVCRQAPEMFTYFPSFEAFRWLPCFQDQSAFGRDDGGLRHANSDIVDQVVAIFMDSTTAREPAPGD